MYADKITRSMSKTIEETNRRRNIQEAYNKKNGIVPKQIVKSTDNSLLKEQGEVMPNVPYIVDNQLSIAEDPIIKYMSRDELMSSIKRVQGQMVREAKKENFIEAAHLRDEMFELKKILLDKYS